MKGQYQQHKDAAEWIKSMPGFTVPIIQSGLSYRVNIANKDEKSAIVQHLAKNYAGQDVTVFLRDGKGKDKFYGDWQWSFVIHYQSDKRIPSTTPVHLKIKKNRISG